MGRLAMDTLDVTGMVMTSSLNAIITDSSPGMAAYATGQKNNNNQEGVFPDNTRDAFDNPRIEDIGELLRRTRGPGFNVGIVTTADVTDSTPGANGAHTSDRYAGAGIAAQFFDEREPQRHRRPSRRWLRATSCRRAPAVNGRTIAGWRRRRACGLHAVSTGWRGGGAPREDAAASGARALSTRRTWSSPSTRSEPGLHNELAQTKNAAYRDTPMLEDLARLALRSLAAHSPAGFYLMLEGASIDKRAHAADPERMIWDIIEFDRAVQVALDFARTTNTDRDPTNDTLVIVTADHETGGMGIIGIGNERYAPRVARKGRARLRRRVQVRRRSAARFLHELRRGWAWIPGGPGSDEETAPRVGVGTDRYDNWLADPLQTEAAVVQNGVAVANTERDVERADRRTVAGREPSRTARPRVPASAQATRGPTTTRSPGTPRRTSHCRPRVQGRGSSPAWTRTPMSSSRCFDRRQVRTDGPDRDSPCPTAG